MVMATVLLGPVCFSSLGAVCRNISRYLNCNNSRPEAQFSMASMASGIEIHTLQPCTPREVLSNLFQRGRLTFQAVPLLCKITLLFTRRRFEPCRSVQCLPRTITFTTSQTLWRGVGQDFLDSTDLQTISISRRGLPDSNLRLMWTE